MPTNERNRIFSKTLHANVSLFSLFSISANENINLIKIQGDEAKNQCRDTM